MADAAGFDEQVLDAQVLDAQVLDAQVLDAQVLDAQVLDEQVLDAPADDAPASDAAALDESMMDGSDSADAVAAIDGTPCNADAADEASSCGGTMSCCSGLCTDTSHDPRNCGSCGNACSSAQFCSGLACQDAVFKNLCANSAATVAFDPYPDDNEAGVRMASALATGCMPPVSVTYANWDAGIGQDPDSGRPITGPGNTLVAGGGSYGQPSVAYIDDKAFSTVRLQADGTDTWFENFRTNTEVVRAHNSVLTSHHDYFLLELTTEPASGTLCFFGIGFLNAGTAAAGYFFQNSVMPSLSTFGNSWYVYEWTDTDGDSLPSAGDTFGPLGSGM